MNHPSKDLKIRQNGFGIAAGLEKPYKKKQSSDEDIARELYCAVPHSGYYGIGIGARPFKTGNASYNDEVLWYKSQYGEMTSKE
jgi:hypothetical protein